MAHPVSSAAQAAQHAAGAPPHPPAPPPGTQPIIQPLPNVHFSGPGAGIYLQKQNEAELAYKQAMADLLQKRNTAYHQYGLGAEGSVDPYAQFGRYQSLLSQHESDLAATDDAAQQRGLGGAGLGMQGERALRYQQGGEDLAMQQEIADIASGYSSGSQQALLARNQAIIDAQLQSLQMSMSSAGGGGGGGFNGGPGLENPDQFHVPGYSGEDINAAAQAYAASHGYKYGRMVMQEGHVETRNGVPGVWIKYVDANGQSTTEWTPLGTPSNNNNNNNSNNNNNNSNNNGNNDAAEAERRRQAEIARLAAITTRSQAGRE